jgi:hypothetical protein
MVFARGNTRVTSNPNDMGWSDLLVSDAMMMMIADDIGNKLVSPMNSSHLNPDANTTVLKPCRIFTTPHTCPRSHRPRNSSLPTDSQWNNNRSH